MKTYGSFMARLFEEPNVHVAIEQLIEQLLREAAAMFTSTEHPRGCMLITAATNCAPESAAVATHLRAIRVSAVEALEGRIHGAIEAEELPAGSDARALALFFVATLQGMSSLARDGASRAELEKVLQSAMRAWPRLRRTTR
jgi:hypothetical protein